MSMQWEPKQILAVNAEVKAFQELCQKHYICHGFSLLGFTQFASYLASQNPDPSKTMHIVTGHPDQGNWQGSMNIGEVLAACQDNGSFPEMIAKAFMTEIYSQWDEHFRPRIATVIGVSSGQVRCDLMGDLRRIRNCIVHNKAVLAPSDCAPSTLDWALQPGPLQISPLMFKQFIDQVNRMHVYVAQKKA